MAIALTYKIKAAGSQQSGEIMVLFFCFWWCCVGCVLLHDVFQVIQTWHA
jgi:hypothetical protein